MPTTILFWIQHYLDLMMDSSCSQPSQRYSGVYDIYFFEILITIVDVYQTPMWLLFITSW